MWSLTARRSELLLLAALVAVALAALGGYLVGASREGKGRGLLLREGFAGAAAEDCEAPAAPASPACPTPMPCPPPDPARWVRRDAIPSCPSLPDMARYMLKTECPPLPDMSKYVLKSSVPACPPCIATCSKPCKIGDCPPCPRPRCPVVQCPEPKACQPCPAARCEPCPEPRVTCKATSEPAGAAPWTVRPVLASTSVFGE